MNTSELNSVLSQEISKLRNGRAKPERVNAITRAASQIIAAARLELSYMRLVGVNQGFFSPFFGKHRTLQAPKKKQLRVIEGKRAA